MRCSLIMPTHNRAEVLQDTLGRIASLNVTPLGGEVELIVVDNASAEHPTLPSVLENGIEVVPILLDSNMHTGARNIAAQRARADWLLMLDDDSSPHSFDFGSVLDEQPADVAAVGADIGLLDGTRESGGLPEVIVGCGCLIRRDAFLSVGGYDERFGYYAEEYDLCAKLIARGQRVVHTRSLRVLHRKSTMGRNFGEILYRLVRNNAWVMQRYAPDEVLDTELATIVDRYGRIAWLEGVGDAFDRGMREVEATLQTQGRTPLSKDAWDRFTGRAAARDTLHAHFGDQPAAVTLLGAPQAKGRRIVEQELERLGCPIQSGTDPGAVPVIGSLSPGPMLDLKDAKPGAICPWAFDAQRELVHKSD